MFDIYQTNDNSLTQHKYDDSPSPEYFFRHIHNNCEIHLFISGKASFNIEGTVFKLAPYDLTLIPPQNYHSLVLDGKAPYERFVFNFPISKFPIDTDKLFRNPQIINISDKPNIKNIFKRLEFYHETLPEEDFVTASNLLIQECLLLLKNEENIPDLTRKRTTLTQDIAHYINENITKPITIDDIAAYFCFSKSHVQNVFGNNMKIGIKSYIIRKKMAYAGQLLSEGISPTDVAEELGFTNYATFYKDFMNVHGISPKYFSK